ncbi:MAG: NTP transferase domain-containing protein [Rhodovarius sp.]|nr:NTP transferase domain-containing protein [Rhodovarius sp.]MCX7932795.1 NTP transferase domain-containing protein [Rhodovarius sp.]MDW8315561.1 NTP transferase domain-containing protein [Rhodovarius sp.]
MAALPDLAILAGGLATRLGAIAAARPKVLVPVAGEPFLTHLLRLARRQGFARVVLCVGHLADQVEAFLARPGADQGLAVALSHEGPARRGTGGALRHALPLLSDPFCLAYGDSLLPVDPAPVIEAFRRSGLPALMCVLHNRNAWDASNVVFDGSRVRRHDKTACGEPGMEWIDAGLSVFRHAPIAGWPEADPWDLSALTGALAAAGELAGYAVKARFHEIGRPESLAETEAVLRAQPELPLF